MAIQFKPEGYHTVTPFLYVQDAVKLIDFLKMALGATELMRHSTPEGKVQHGEIKIGDSIIMIADAQGDMTPITSINYLYVEDGDKLYKQAMAAGAKSMREPTTEFYGDRTSGIIDPAGNQWWIATHVEDVSQEELAKRMAAMGDKMH
jgi:uncharacterized glyoxalase superfamily protein PhnB